MNKNILTLILLVVSSLVISQSYEQKINKLLDGFHYAAAIADEDLFFNSMTSTAHYIGTDASEDWTREELREWSKNIFDRKVAWDFKPINRNIYFHTDDSLAWFNETLDTWMGICRGSGVVVKTKNGWKVEQYVLSITVPNKIIIDYLELLDNNKLNE